MAALSVTGIIAYSHYKDVEHKKEAVKLDDKKNKKETKKDDKKSSKNNTQTNNETNQASATAPTQQNTQENNVESNQYSSNDINKEITNEYESVNTGEVAPNPQQNNNQGNILNSNNNGSNQPKYKAEDAKHMTDDQFLAAYKEGMTKDEAAFVDENAKRSADYINFLRGQVEARAHGQGGNY